MSKYIQEPYRLFFPIGILFLLIGSFLWVPQLWNPGGDYPVALHRFFMLNGFVSFFIGGFLMTAIPKFSQTNVASKKEVIAFGMISLLGLVGGLKNNEQLIYISSSLQAGHLLIFMLSRIAKRKMNPPYAFIFIPAGLLLWMVSGILCAFQDPEIFKHLHFEGAITAIILGVGSRLLPGILGHVEIVSMQREVYERPESFLKIVPVYFYFLVVAFVGSYFLSLQVGAVLRLLIVAFVAFRFWRLYQLPKEKSALTFCLWGCGWMIVFSYVLKASWWDGNIHASHAFFLSGIVLLCLLIATRVIQSHGPKDKRLESSKILYVMLVLTIIAAATRVSAYLMPEHYLSHLSYSAMMLTLAVIIWSIKFLRFIRP